MSARDDYKLLDLFSLQCSAHIGFLIVQALNEIEQLRATQFVDRDEIIGRLTIELGQAQAKLRAIQDISDSAVSYSTMAERIQLELRREPE